MLSKLANNRLICQGFCHHYITTAENTPTVNRTFKWSLTSKTDWDVHTFTYWFEKYTNSLADEPFILAICYVK